MKNGLGVTKDMKMRALKMAFPYTIPVMLGYIFLGIAFGILLASKGYGFGWAILISVFVYAGSMQFVAIGILTSPFNLISAIILTLSVNARHLFYGLSMITKFKDLKKLKLYMIFSLTDETYSLLCSVQAPSGVQKEWFYFFISLLNHIYWVLGSAIGGIAGSLFHFNSKGIDFAMTALFVVIFIEQWENMKVHIPALTGVFVSLLALFLFGETYFIIPSMIGIFVVLSILRKTLEKRLAD